MRRDPVICRHNVGRLVLDVDLDIRQSASRRVYVFTDERSGWDGGDKTGWDVMICERIGCGVLIWDGTRWGGWDEMSSGWGNKSPVS